MPSIHPYQLNIRGHLLSLATPQVMGVINMTPDSFFSGSKYSQEKAVLTTVEEMVEAGASLIDIGGMSSRPGADMISTDEEWQRVKGAIHAIASTFPSLPLSIDTLHAEVAKNAVEAGATIINDISGGQYDRAIWSVAAHYRTPYILMHMQGMPTTMQQAPTYDDVVLEVFDFFRNQVQAARNAGVGDIVIDPGFGFGKSLAHNYQLLMQLPVFAQLEVPILTGVSRKSMINKVLGTSPDTALNGTTVLHTLALERGAHILRAHDVKEAYQSIQLVTFAQTQQT